MWHSGINGMSFSASISGAVQAMIAWFAPLNRQLLKFSFSVLFMRICCTGSEQYPTFPQNAIQIHARWWKNVPYSNNEFFRALRELVY